MSTTPNYGWPLLATNQASPEVTHNAAITDIDQAFGSLLVTAMTDADYTLNLAAVPSEASYLVYQFTGTLTANRNIIVPANKKLYVVWNNATSPYNLTVKTSGGTGVAVPYGATAQYVLLYCDGTNVVFIGITQSEGASVNAQISNYVAVLSDNNNVVSQAVAGACTFTVPNNSSVAFPIGATLSVMQAGTGQITLTPVVGVTINTASSLTTRAQWSIISLVKISTNVWVAAGDLT